MRVLNLEKILTEIK
jgi:CubicO group peptidase (beta-lactamase class C family)